MEDARPIAQGHPGLRPRVLGAGELIETPKRCAHSGNRGIRHRAAATPVVSAHSVVNSCSDEATAPKTPPCIVTIDSAAS